jgi:1,2-diacylglycerol 3-beta-galactosyltransferase
MRAADVLVTKAGPGTLSEAFNAGLPILLYDFLPGQEEGNVGYVVQAGAGLWAPGPKAVVQALRQWVGPQAEAQALARAAENARKLARPDAARRIAQFIWQQIPPA